MTTSVKIKLALAFLVLALLGVISALLTTNRDLLNPLPRSADVKVIFTSPPPSPTSAPTDSSADEEEPTKEPAKKPTAKPTVKPVDKTPTPKPTISEASPSAEPTT